MLSSCSSSSSSTKLLTRVLSGSRIRRPFAAATAAAATTTTTTTTTAAMPVVRAIVFDVDDCLYDVASGFTAHRNGEIIWRYMVDRHGFDSMEDARTVRDEYFARYHSSAKALTIAQKEGRFPDTEKGRSPFDPKDMSRYWVDHLDYDKLWGNPAYETKEDSREAKREFAAALRRCPAKLVAFSNGPRAYVGKVLDTLGYLSLFSSDEGDGKDGAFYWGVDDVLPHCKPEPEAFRKIFDALVDARAKASSSSSSSSDDDDEEPIRPEDCVMVEDSMKNLRAAKALGMKTVLITGTREEGRILAEDAPSADDPSIDVAIPMAEDLPRVLPGLWNDPPVFEPPPSEAS